MIRSVPFGVRLADALPPVVARPLRALSLLPPDTAGMFLGLADDLFGAWPPEGREATGRAARRARALLPLAA